MSELPQAVLDRAIRVLEGRRLEPPPPTKLTTEADRLAYAVDYGQHMALQDLKRLFKEATKPR